MKIARLNALALVFVLALPVCTVAAQSSAVLDDQIHSGIPWFDSAGNRINAHGGGVYFFNHRYYWYGSDEISAKAKRGEDNPQRGIHAYSSADLVHWKNEGLVFSVDHQHPNRDISYGCFLERPKVIYDARSRKYLAYFKLYPPGTKNYLRAFVGVASANSPAGPFTYVGKWLGGGAEFGTGDFAIFQDEDGSLFHLAPRKPDLNFVIGKFDPVDLTAPATGYRQLPGVTNSTEAPVLVHHGGKYYLLGSGMTGYETNPARSFAADSLYGPYENLGNFALGVNPHNGLGPEKTFGAQISFVIPVHGKSNAYIAIFDVWNLDDLSRSTYVWLPLVFEHGRPVVRWIDAWNPQHYFAENPSRRP